MSKLVSSKDNSTFLYRFVSGTMYTGIGTGLRIISGIIATKILATYLPSSEFGYAILIELIANFLRMVSGVSIGVAAVRSLTGAEYAEQKTIVDTVVIFRFITFVLVALIFLFTQRWVYWLFGKEPVENLTALILGFTLVLAYQSVLKQMLQGFFRFKQMAFIDLGASILTLTLLVVFLVWFQLGLVGVILARIIAAGVASLFFYFSLPTKKGLSLHFDMLIKMLRFSWPLQANEIITFTYRSFGTVVVATVMTPADVALLSVAGKVPTNFGRLYEAFRTVYFPNLTSLLARGDLRRAHKMLNVTLRVIAFFMAFATMLAFVFQKEIILLLYSEQYLDAGPIFVLMMLATTINLIIFVMGNSTVAAGDSKAPAIINTVNTIFTVFGNLTLVPVFGVIGTVLTNIITRVATSSLNVWFLRRTGLIPIVSNYIKPVLLFSVLYGVAWWLQPQTWLAKLPFLLVFLVASFLLSIVTFKDIDTARNGAMQLWRTLGAQRSQ